MRDVGIAVIRAVGVDTGGCNIQFAINPDNGRMIVIEMNPRVSRSSALASKATGFPIAKIAAKVAVGYTLDEIPNDITAETPASFEPTLDYIVVKAPRFAFEKFPTADSTLTTHMKSVGEANGDRSQLHRGTRQGAAVSGGCQGRLRLHLADYRDPGRGPHQPAASPTTVASTGSCGRSGWAALPRRCTRPRRSTRGSWTSCTSSSRWPSGCAPPPELTADLLRLAKRHGLADPQIAKLRNLSEDVVRGVRWALGVRPVYKTVDTCAAEFAARYPLPLLVLRRGDGGGAARESRPS